MEALLYPFWLASIPGLGSKRIDQLFAHFGSVQAIYQASQEELLTLHGFGEKITERIIATRREDHIKRRYDWMYTHHIQVTYRDSSQYPASLRPIYNPPFALFYKGNLPEPGHKTVAVVGARNASYGSCQIAASIGRSLAENGIAVVSGLARGIDISSQRGVLQIAGGRTYGILGCGIDQCYPQQHIESYMQMQENGGILSEYAPGIPAVACHFPMRNRIISGLADAILVIEARKKSGSLITAEMGLEQGKDILVIPGDITNPSFEGSNKLIQNGACLVTNVQDILDALGIFTDEDITVKKKKYEVMLETTEKIVYSYLSLEPIHLSQIASISNFSVQKLMEILLSLEMKGVVKDVGNHYFAIVI